MEQKDLQQWDLSRTQTESEGVQYWTSRPICDTCGEPRYQEIPHPMKPGGVALFPAQCACERKETERAQAEWRRHMIEQPARTMRERWDMDELPLVGQTFESWDWDRQPAMNPVYDAVKLFADSYHGLRPTVGLLLRGETKGTGKSHLLNAAAQRISRVYNIPAVTIEWAVFLDRMMPSSRFWSEEEKSARWSDLQTVPFLVLNDVARFKPSEWNCNKLFVLLEARAGRACTCFSANSYLSDKIESVRDPQVREDLECCVNRIEALAKVVPIPDDAVSYRHVMRLERERGEK